MLKFGIVGVPSGLILCVRMYASALDLLGLETWHLLNV
jgi:hypothetical protein